ncbi:MAG: arylsulfatase A-like enzyme [Bacteroidia bacterium]|jgi:arylsulfatase A-like enzyme
MNAARYLSVLVLLFTIHVSIRADDRPNIIVILADDMGYSDIGPYGSEISTPSLDKLAKGGLKFTQFYNAARCCPTRASLLTGLYPHQTGIGNMTSDQGEESYRGDLSRQCMTIAEVLKDNGYKTYMSGKWHVTKHVDQWRTWLSEDKRIHTSKMNWPIQRGFDEFFGTIHGAGSFFNPSTLTRNNTPIEAKDGFYYTDEISDHADQFIRQHAKENTNTPFFTYIAYTAPHWPLHALPEDIKKYKGMYDKGWDKVRKDRMKRMVDMGIIDPNWELSERDPNIPAWKKAEDKVWWAACMEVYAAMVDRMDQGIGKVINTLLETNQLDNTLIFFLSDNGGCAEVLTDKWRRDLHIPSFKKDGTPIKVGNDVTRLPGSEDTYMSYSTEWANASNTPFRLYKHFIHEGGISTPLIAHWPAGIKSPNRMTNQVGHLIDIMATCVDVAGANYPTSYNGYQIKPAEGQSLVPAFNNRVFDHRPIGWEHHGNRGFRDGKWKIVDKNANDKWELYDIEADRTELNNLVTKYPGITQEMIEKYTEWASHVGVIRWRDRK